MAVALMIDNPNGTQDLYEKVLANLDLDRPAGGTLHVAGPSPNGGWRVIEVFESAEAASRFITERLGPAFRAAGASGPPPEPQLWPVHNCIT
jgi:hypothetical protein